MAVPFGVQIACGLLAVVLVSRIALPPGPVTNVPTQAGRGSWYLVSWTPSGAEEGRYHAFGTVVDGTRITVLSIDNGGQDYNYAPGKEPMTGMVRAAAAKLG